jgi:hypothetical protein
MRCAMRLSGTRPVLSIIVLLLLEYNCSPRWTNDHNSAAFLELVILLYKVSTTLVAETLSFDTCRHIGAAGPAVQVGQHINRANVPLPRNHQLVKTTSFCFHCAPPPIYLHLFLKIRQTVHICCILSNSRGRQLYLFLG